MKTSIVKKMMAVINCLAVVLVAQTANSACIWFSDNIADGFGW